MDSDELLHRYFLETHANVWEKSVYRRKGKMVILITCIEDIISSFPSAIKKKYDLL